MSVKLPEQRIRDLFNLLASHFHDKFVRLSDQSFTSWKQLYPDFSEFVVFNDDKAFTLKNFSTLIQKILNQEDFLLIGDNAFQFVKLIREIQDINQFSWLNSDLKAYCDSRVMTINSSVPLLIPNSTTIVNETLNTQETTNQSLSANDTIFSQQLASLKNDFQSQLNNFFACSLNVQVKDEHFSHLELLTNKHVTLNNSSTINQSYISHEVYATPLQSINFPAPWFKDDPIYLKDFNILINKFQKEIQQLQDKYLKEKLKTLDSEIKDKIDLISIFDKEASNKYHIMKDRAVSRHKLSLEASNNKIARLIEAKNNPTYESQNQNNSTNSKQKFKSKSTQTIEKPFNKTQSQQNTHKPNLDNRRNDSHRNKNQSRFVQTSSKNNNNQRTNTNSFNSQENYNNYLYGK